MQPAALLLLAVAVGITAWQTWRAVQVRRERLEPHRAVNRLVLGRAAALVGALVAGGYAGYAVSWVGDRTPSWPASGCSDRPSRGSPAIAIVVAGLLLERACRVQKRAPRSPSLLAMSSPSVTQATRRRQRRTRVTVAVGLLLLAALVVSGAAA